MPAHRPLSVLRAFALLWLLLLAAVAQATPNLQVGLITWNVVGLKSNGATDPTGPNTYLVGARVCNTGTSPAVNVQADFIWDSSNTYVNLEGASSLSLELLPNGVGYYAHNQGYPTPAHCADFYYNIVVSRTTAAFYTQRLYRIGVSADNYAGTAYTPSNRGIYVEKFVSQARNSVASVTGPSQVYVGRTYEFTVTGSTATQGYEQLVFAASFSNIVWQILEVRSDYAAPVGATNNSVYADACGWDSVTTSATYLSCIGPENYVGAKAGGSFSTTYKVRVLAIPGGGSSGSTTVNNIVYDMSGSSFHYNSDYGTGGGTFSITVVPSSTDLGITASATPASVEPSDAYSYQLSVTNYGPDAVEGDAQGVTVTAQLPADATVSSYTPSQGTCTVTGTTLTCYLGDLPKDAVATIDLNMQAPATEGVLSMTANVSSHTTDPNMANNTATVLVPVSTGVNVAGQVFEDLQPNQILDTGEDWTGGTSVYVNLVQGGSVLQSVNVLPGAGTFMFTAVAPGEYDVVLTNNATSTTATAPSGWLLSTPPDGRVRVLVSGNNLANAYLGLYHGSKLEGMVLRDNGAGGGTSADALRNGSEVGLSGLRVSWYDAGNTQQGQAYTDAQGYYSLWLPHGYAGTTLRVTPQEPSGYLSISGSAGTTGGSYTRSDDSVRFVMAAGVQYGGVNFGDAPSNALAPDHVRQALPGAVLFYPFTFTVNSAGSVSFSMTQDSVPMLEDWSALLYRDADCNGVIGSGDPLLTAAVSGLQAGDTVCLLAKVFVPVAAPFGAQHQLVVQALFDYANAAPALVDTMQRQALTQVVLALDSGEALSLAKTADRTSAAPGDVIVYVIAYENVGSEAIDDLVIHDATPAYTTFLTASCGVLPADLSGCSITVPGAGAAGDIRWVFNGSLRAGGQGTVEYHVQVDN